MESRSATIDGAAWAAALPKARARRVLRRQELQDRIEKETQLMPASVLPALFLIAASLSGPAVRSPTPPELLYVALAYAETGGERNPFIRTRVQVPGGSTAYGPVQITGTLGADFLERYRGLFDREETWYLERFLRQADLFRKYGNASHEYGYNRRYDYGGSGHLDTAYDKWLYRRVALKMIEVLYREQGSLDAFIRRWRGTEDPAYRKKVLSRLPKDFSENW